VVRPDTANAMKVSFYRCS